MLKKTFLNVLKILFAVSIIFWLIRNDTLDLSGILKLFSNLFILLVTFPLCLIQIFISAKRWQVLLQAKSQNITDTKRIVMINWIGQFFSVALPGVVTGDLIKLSYVKKMDHKLTTTFLLLSVFLDRLIGLISLLLISGFSSIIFFNDLVDLNPIVRSIIAINLLLLICGFMGVGFFLLPYRAFNSISKVIKFKKINDLLEGFKSVQLDKLRLIKLFSLSIFTQLLTILTFHVINYSSYQTTIRLKDLLTIVPLGFISIAIPISPAGLGVGHLAFQKLFSFLNQTNGANLFNNFWIFYLVMNLLGVIPYIFFKHQNK